MNAERFYTLPEAAVEAGMEYRTLHSWIQRGLLVPEHLKTVAVELALPGVVGGAVHPERSARR